MKISVIMPSYLGDYPGGATDRESKFIRAVDSFRRQDYQDKELIVVSDGCQKTIDLCNRFKIQLFSLPKQVPFSGEVRNFGIKYAKGKIITYLDTDDYYEQGHLTSIAKSFGDNDWVYWDDYVLTNDFIKHKRNTEMKFAKIGTSCIAHKKNVLKWGDGYGHDWNFIQDLMGVTYPVGRSVKYSKIETVGYVVCHIHKITDI